MSKNTCVIKFVHKDDVRRVRIDTSNFTFHECKRKSQELYPDLLNGSIQYKDDEDELCTISNNTELAEAFYVVEQSDKRSCLRLFIAKEENNVQNSKTTTTFMNRHQNVVKQTKSTKPKTSKPLKASAKNTKSTKSTKSTNDTQTDAVKSRIERRRIIKSKDKESTSTSLPKTSTSKPSKPSKPAKPSKPSKPVPLQTTSGGAKLFLDGTVEFGFGGDAFLRPDGKVECLMNGNGFPSVKAQHLCVDSGKWYYECHLLTPGCMQIGWVTPNYTGDASQGNGVGDDTFSWAYDGYRQLRWHNGASESWSNKWKTGDTVCLALDCKRGELRFALNGQWPSHSDSIAFTGLNVKQMGGLIPAASFSNGQKLRFNFGADGTPLAFNPPDNSYLPIWNAYGTKSNIASALPALERRSPVSKRNVQGETKDTNDNGTVNGKDNGNENGGTDEMLDSQLVQLLKLINRKEIRDSLSIALSNPLVAESMQAALESIIASSMSGADRSAIFASLLQEHCVKLLPIGLGLIAKHPELIAVATLLQGVLLPTAAGCPAKQHHHHKHRNKCGGGGGGRANRSANWRQQQGQQLGHPLEPGFGVGEQIRQWTGKIVEVAADVANTVHDTVHETVTGNKAREKLNEENLKKAIAASEQDVLDTEKQALQQAVSLSVQKYKSLFQDNDKNTETSKKPVVVIAKKKKNPWSKGETKTDPTDPTDSTKTKTVSAKALKVVQQRAVAIPKARFIKDSKGSHPALLPGQPFSHTWRLMNNGKEKWNENVSVRCVGGDAMKGSEMSVPVACIGPNQVVDATIQLSAPEVPGRYICYFRLHQQNERFGDRIWIDVTVVDPDKLSDKQMNAMFPVAQQQDMKVEQKEVNIEQKEVKVEQAIQVEQEIQDEQVEQVEPEMEEEMEIVAKLEQEFENEISELVADPVAALPILNDDENEDEQAGATTDSMNELTDWDMVTDSMRALSTSGSLALVTKEQEEQNETKEEIVDELVDEVVDEVVEEDKESTEESAPPAPPALASVTLVAEMEAEEQLNERVKKQLEKLVELGFKERAAATALVQCNGDLGDAVTLLLAASGRLG